MLLQIFKSNQSIVGLLVVLLTIALWVPGFFISQEIILSKASTKFNDIFFLFEPKWINVLLTSFLIGGQAIFLNYIINSQKLLKSNTFLVALFYVIINSAGGLIFSLNSIVIANTFILLILHQIFKLYNVSSANSIIFNLGLFIGVATVIYLPLISLLLLGLIAITYVKPPKGKDFLILLIGFFVPIIYWVTYLYLTNQISTITKGIDIFKISFTVQENYDWSYFTIVFWIIVFISLFNLIVSLGRNVMKIKKLLMISLLLMFFCGLTTFISNQNYLITYLLLSIPSAIFIAHFFSNIKRKILGELLLIIIIAAVVLDYFL